MAITTEAGLAAATQNGKRVRFYKTSLSASAGVFYTHWRNTGFPGPGTTPTTTGAALSRTSAGALPIPAASGTSYIAEWEGTMAGTSGGVLMLADRLVEFGGLSSIVTTAQTVSALALPARATAATDVELWLEVYVAVGASGSPVVTASYTNQSGTSGRTATLIGGLPAAGTTTSRSYPMALQGGDTGVQSVESLTLGTSTGTAGNIGLVLRRTLLTGPVDVASNFFYQSWAETDLQQCPDDAALELMVLANGTTGIVQGAVRLAQG